MNMRKSCLVVAAAGACAAAWGAGLSPASYVQRGLVMQFDAIDNRGTGVHDPAATEWKDLKGTARMAVASGAQWVDRALDMGRQTHLIAGVPAYSLDSVSTEVAMDLLEKSADGWSTVFTDTRNSESLYRIYVSPGSHNAALYIHGEGTRPSFGSVDWGTLAISCSTNFCYTYRSAPWECAGGRSGSLGKSAGAVAAGDGSWNFQGYGGGYIHGLYRGIRHYACALTQNELAWNALVDNLRFFSFTHRGTGGRVDWASVPWTKPRHAGTDAPAGAGDYVRLVQVRTAMPEAEPVVLAGLSLEDGAALEVAEGGVVTVGQLLVEGEMVDRGVYTGTGPQGTPAAWIAGRGQVRVLGPWGKTIPEPVPGLGPLSYVQAGLITQFDALDNEGTGTFNAEAAVWKDLVGNASVTLAGNAAWKDRALDTGASQQTITGMPNFYFDSVFSEFAVKIVSHEGGYPRLFYHYNGGNNSDGWYNVFHQNATSTEMHFFLGGQSQQRPAFNFSEGTLELGSDTRNIRTYSNGVAGGASGNFALSHKAANAGSWFLDKDGKLHSQFRAFRHYNRALTEDEIARNREIDIQRFESFAFRGDGGVVDWSGIGWDVPNVGSVTTTAPSAATNDSATVANAVVRIAATDEVALRGLSLEYGATLEMAAGAVVSTKLLYVDGRAVGHGIYTGPGGTAGHVVDWIAGAGQVRVAGATNRLIPSVWPTADADGWYTFGLMDGKDDQAYFIGEHPVWDDYDFPAGAKLRLRGFVLLETVPDVFADYDTAQLQYALVAGARAYAADRPFDAPRGAKVRYFPGTWKPSATVENRHDLVSANTTLAGQLSGDVNVSGTFEHYNDRTVNITHTGCIAGTGALWINSYGRQVRFTGAFALGGNASANQNGNGFWLDTLAVTSGLQTVTLGGCGDAHGMTTSYSASFVMFGRDGSGETADHPLDIVRLNGNASSRVDAAGKRWRSGGHVIVWGSNTVHVGALHAGLHAVGSRADQDCVNAFLNPNYKSQGIGFLEIDAFNTGTVYGSTNVEVTVGTMAAGTGFDFTYQSNGVNRLALDITGTCAVDTTVKATDLAMLPARLSGFAGTVTLTEAEAKRYEMPINFAAGLDGIYNPVGCDGSGTLAAAPATGAIDVTFPTGDVEVEPGKYALARFSAGGGLLKDWTVTLNGEQTSTARVGHHTLQVKKDATGIWLGADLPSMAIILR